MRDVVVDLDPHVRIVGSLLGDWPSRRRGRSPDVASSRPYVAGDDIRHIDWAASARLSSLAGEERFVVREWFAEESPTVVVAIDRSPSMALYPAGLPWLSKPAAVERCLSLVLASAAHHRCMLASTDSLAGGLLPPLAAGDARARPLVTAPGAIPAHPGWLRQALEDGRRWLPPGTIVVWLSDFLAGLDEETLVDTADAEIELVPVVVSDPTWERSFPEVGGMTVPASAGCSLAPRRIGRREARDLRARHERRHGELLELLERFDVPAVVPHGDRTDDLVGAFARWAEERP